VPVELPYKSCISQIDVEKTLEQIFNDGRSDMKREIKAAIAKLCLGSFARHEIFEIIEGVK